jgi:hypothetical protein
MDSVGLLVIFLKVKLVILSGTDRRYPPLRKKSAHAHENKRVSFRSLAKERAKSAEVFGNATVIFSLFVKECASF